jgi:putative membrane protein
MFGSLISNTRNLARLTWVYVNPAPAMSEKQHQTFLSLKGKAAFDPNSAYEGSLLRGEKVRLLKLVIAFAYAVKNHLRQNFESENEELSGLLPPEMGEFLADWNGAFVGGRYGTDAGGSGSVLGEGLTESAISTAVAGNGNGQGDGSGSKTNGAPTRKNTQATARTPLLSDPGDTIVSFHPPGVDKILPLPLIITHEITNIVYKFKKAGCLETVGPAGVSSLMGLVQGMTDQLSTMERISTTPIPGSYSIHLKQCITLYLFALPFTLVEDLHWRMIPIVTVVAFTLMGIEGIADEIEMPFGRDRSDLPLDRLCDELRAEVTYIIEKMPEGSDDT